MNRGIAEVIIRALSFFEASVSLADRFKRFSLREWEMTLRWLDRSGLSLYFWKQLKQLGLQDAVPPAIGAGLEARYTQNCGRTRAILDEWRYLQNLFDSSGVRCVVLKGLSKIPDYCPDPALRVQFDYDWLIDRKSFDRADEALRFAGYERKNKPERDRAIYTKNNPPLGRAWDPSDSYDARLPRSVEIHLDLWDSYNESIRVSLPGDLILRRVPRKWEGDRFFSLSDEDALVFEALHTFRHIIHNWCRLSLLFELAQFINRRSSDCYFWKSFCARIERSLELRRIAGMVFSLAGTIFNVPDAFGGVPSEFFAQTRQLQLWVGRYGKSSALTNFAEDKFSLFLLRQFVKEADGWRRVRRRRLFPLRAVHCLPAPIRRGAFAGLIEKYRSGIRLVRRLRVHMRGTLLYAGEYPRWRLAIRRDQRNRLSNSGQGPVQGRQTNLSLYRQADGLPVDSDRPLR